MVCRPWSRRGGFVPCQIAPRLVARHMLFYIQAVVVEQSVPGAAPRRPGSFASIPLKATSQDVNFLSF